MRIISGKYKGKKLLLPKNEFTRPLKDLVKESIFNLLEHSNKINLKIKNSNILDLFSGCGSFGLECISRGSDEVYFFENYDKALYILKKNLFSLKKKENFKIFEKDCFLFFDSNQQFDKKFDIIFIDPPYKEVKINNLLNKIIEKKILKHNGMIILHRHKKDKIELTKKVKIIEKRDYGISRIYFAH